MYKPLIFILLFAIVAQKAHGQDFQSTAEDTSLYEPESQIDVPDEEHEGSGAHSFGEKAGDVPLIDETETTPTSTSDVAITCPTDLCTCSQEKIGEDLKLTVDCSSRSLADLPEGIDKRVTRLLLQKNKFEEIPKAISEFKELEELNVNENSIKGFAFGSVSELPKLRILKVSNNRLIEFPLELKNGLDFTSLQELDLGNNDMRDTLTADLFTHMEQITSLTIPISKHELIEDLCHRLSPTLKQICTNDCNLDIEECVNYADNSSELLPQPSSDFIENNNEPESENKDDIETVGTGELELITNEEQPTNFETDDNLKFTTETLTSVLDEESDSTTEADNVNQSIETTTVVNTSSIVSENTNEVDFELRSAVNNALDAGDNSVRQDPEVNLVQTPTETIFNTERSENENDKFERQQLNENAHDGVKVGATSIKQGGGIDNSVIALIVAGMVVVVAGVTIKKNWSSIRNRFHPRQPPAVDTEGANGTTPEEVPLQDKSMV